MRVIPTSVHGIMDYLTALLLISSPWLLGFYRGGLESFVPIVAGAVIMLQALMTRNETGAVKVMPMPAHLVSDLAIGVFLALSPWLLMFHDIAWEPHVFFGIVITGQATFTHMKPTHVS